MAHVQKAKMIEGAKPYFFGEESAIMAEISAILKSGKLTQGERLRRFEEAFAKNAGTNYALGVSSGGTGLELILKAIDVQDQEVIVPTDTFVATASAVCQAGGHPVFCDVRRKTLSIDVDQISRLVNARTRAIILVPMFGLLDSDIMKIKDFCQRRNIFLIEDAAHAHGAKYRNIPSGSIGDAACFSFYATKVLTCGEGGIISTNNESIYKKVASLRNHGKSLEASLFDEISNNYRLAEIPSVLAYYQLKHLEENISRRNRLAAIYREELISVPDVELLQPDEKSYHSYWRYPLYLKNSSDKALFQKRMHEEYGVRITWMYEPLCHLQPVFQRTHNHAAGDFPVAEACIKDLVCLPTHMGLTAEEAKYIAKALKDILEAGV